ncbi:hypothetical protein BsWGS_14066 [Bradybaena similaris]
MLPNATAELGNCSNTTSINETVEEYLKQLQDRTNVTLIPAVVMMSTFAIVGLIGNILVLIVYSKKFTLSPTKVLIMTIASFDLVANIGGIPSEINIMYDSWNFNSPGVCKSKVFLGAFSTVGGAISLLVVAVVRYRKVCRPYGWQVSIKQAVIASIVTAIVAFIYSVPYVIIYGIRSRNTPCPNIQGRECFADDSLKNTVWPLINNVLFILLFLSLSVPMVVLYIILGYTAWKHSRMFVVTKGAKRFAKESTRNMKSGGAKASPNATLEQESSADSERIVSLEKPSRAKSAKELFTNVRMQAVLCCVHQENNEKNDEETRSSTQKATSTTAATNSDDVNKSLETLNSESSLPYNASSMSLNIPAIINASHLLDTASDVTPESSDQHNISEDCIRYDKKEDALSKHRIKTLNHQLIENASNCEVSKDNQKNDNNRVTSKQKQQPKESKPKPVEKAKKEERRRPLGRMTIMLLIISAIFVLGYFPFLALTTFKTKYQEKYESLGTVAMSFFNLFYRLYFLNSAANPIIYSLCDVRFRRECFRLMTFQSRKTFY